MIVLFVVEGDMVHKSLVIVVWLIEAYKIIDRLIHNYRLSKQDMKILDLFVIF